MKRLTQIFTVLTLVILLSGCRDILVDPPQDECEPGQTYNEETEKCEVDEPVMESILTHTGSKEIIDQMYFFNIDDESVDIYTVDGDTSSYIDMKAFINQTESTTMNITMTEMDDSLVLTYVNELHPYLADLYGRSKFVYTVEFDTLENSITINNIDFYSNVNAPVDSPDSQLMLVAANYIGSPEETVIDLNEYEMKLYKENGVYYMPLYLTGLFLTGDMVSVYETDDSVVLFDTGADFEEVKNLVSNDEQDSLEITELSENFLKLYFEVFYGLDEEFAYNFDALIDSYNLDEQESFDDYYYQLDSFLVSLDDIHTSLGYTGSNAPEYLPISEFEEGTRYSDFIQAFEDNACLDSAHIEYEIYKQDSTMHILINSFTENTGYLVEDAISQSHGIENVIIDLRCNSGGSLLGVLELLTLVTNDELELNIYNPQTDIYEKQKIKNYTSRALDAEFFVLTSEHTFSGGNLFASIVKDEGAALILGTPSSGGACAINLAVLPDGSIIVTSGNFALRNYEDQLIEYGITPNIVIEDYIPNVFNLNLDSILSIVQNYDYEFRREGNHVAFDFFLYEDIYEYDEAIIHYIVRDANHKEAVWFDEEYTADFNREFDISMGGLLYEVVLMAEVTIDGMTFVDEIFSVELDDHPNYVSEDCEVLSQFSYTSLGFYERWDQDCFKIVVQNEGTYRIYDESNSEVGVRWYSPDETLLHTGETYYLEEGVYYVQIFKKDLVSHNISYELLYDDTTEDVVIDITEGVTTHTAHIDYPRDEEVFEFQIYEHSIVTISLDLDETDSYTLSNLYGMSWEDWLRDIKGNESITVILNPGTYHLELLVHNAKDVVATIELDTTHNDLTHSYEDPNENFGTLTIGETHVTFEALGDKDVYKLVLTEDKYLYITNTFGGVVYYFRDHIYNSIHSTVDFYEAGTYWFDAQTYNDVYYEGLTIIVQEIDVEYDDDIVREITLGEKIQNITTSEDDIDYYTLTISEAGNYTFDKFGRDVAIMIYDENHTFLRSLDYSDLYTVFFEEGTYEIELQYRISSFYGYAKVTEFTVEKAEQS